MVLMLMLHFAWMMYPQLPCLFVVARLKRRQVREEGRKEGKHAARSLLTLTPDLRYSKGAEL